MDDVEAIYFHAYLGRRPYWECLVMSHKIGLSLRYSFGALVKEMMTSDFKRFGCDKLFKIAG